MKNGILTVYKNKIILSFDYNGKSKSYQNANIVIDDDDLIYLGYADNPKMTYKLVVDVKKEK